jgi:hypothetical protein
MKLRKLNILLFLVLASSVAFGQESGAIKIDTTICYEEYNKLKLSDKNTQRALAGVENYIKGFLTDRFLPNVWLDYCESRESGFQLSSKNINQLEWLGGDICYELQYFVIDKKDTIGYFQLLVDKDGNPMKRDYGTDLYNHPELIAGFKKYFDKKFKYSFSQAVSLGKQKGFWTKPFLQCEIENKLISNSNGDIFFKIKYYWSFFQIWDGGNTAILNINAETGNIEFERYIPRMPG